MLRILATILILLPASLNAQYLKSSDFHSEFERMAFEQLTAGKALDPAIFLFTVDKDNGFDEFQHYSLHINATVSEIRGNEIPKGDIKLVKKAFRDTQKENFKRYKLYESLAKLIKDGNYNCISGTAYYAILFRELGFKTFIFETPYHTFLEIENTKGERMLIESTDRAFGVIDKPKKIESRREEYAFGDAGFIPKGLGSTGSMPDQKHLVEIDIMQLAALQYYNTAVVEFNEGHFEEASVLLKKGSMLYPSSRIILLQMLSDKMMASLN